MNLGEYLPLSVTSLSNRTSIAVDFRNFSIWKRLVNFELFTLAPRTHLPHAELDELVPLGLLRAGGRRVLVRLVHQLTQLPLGHPQDPDVLIEGVLRLKPTIES
jgi:hypothetical protein